MYYHTKSQIQSLALLRQTFRVALGQSAFSVLPFPCYKMFSLLNMTKITHVCGGLDRDLEQCCTTFYRPHVPLRM